MSALKPCPYCGGDATLFGTTLEGWVGCTNRACPAQPSVFPKSTGGKDIAAAWNTRAADTVNADLLAALPDLSSVIGWLENGCEPVAAATELRIYQNRIRAAIARATGAA